LWCSSGQVWHAIEESVRSIAIGIWKSNYEQVYDDVKDYHLDKDKRYINDHLG
jgi:hypothetical protein